MKNNIIEGNNNPIQNINEKKEKKTNKNGDDNNDKNVNENNEKLMEKKRMIKQIYNINFL